MVYWWLWKILYRTCMYDFNYLKMKFLFCFNPDTLYQNEHQLFFSILTERNQSSLSLSFSCAWLMWTQLRRDEIWYLVFFSSLSIDEQSLDRENYLSMNRIISFSGPSYVPYQYIYTLELVTIWSSKKKRKSHQNDGLIFFCSGICHFWNCTASFMI